jgi:hypothetical protein
MGWSLRSSTLLCEREPFGMSIPERARRGGYRLMDATQPSKLHRYCIGGDHFTRAEALTGAGARLESDHGGVIWLNEVSCNSL